MPEQIYLDYNATAPARPQVIEAVVEALQVVGNPSSVHTAGRAARRLMEDARRQVGALAGTRPANVVFTAGATESNNLALSALGTDIQKITSTAEHPSILEAGDALRIDVDANGLMDLVALEQALSINPDQRKLVSVIMVNNETGVIQPVDEICALAHQYGAFIHCDAVQAAGKIPLDFDARGIDLTSLSAHKIGGPKGIGALVVNPKHQFDAVIRGGGQEKGRRAGTENVAGAAGFGVAAQLVMAEEGEQQRLKDLRDGLERILKERLQDLVIIGADAPRAAHVTCIAWRGLKAETQVMAMDLAGFAVSAGSACSSGKVRQSHVLAAMGYEPDIAGSGIRVSFGWASGKADAEKFADAYASFIERQQDAA